MQVSHLFSDLFSEDAPGILPCPQPHGSDVLCAQVSLKSSSTHSTSPRPNCFSDSSTALSKLSCLPVHSSPLCRSHENAQTWLFRWTLPQGLEYTELMLCYPLNSDLPETHQILY